MRRTVFPATDASVSNGRDTGRGFTAGYYRAMGSRERAARAKKFFRIFCRFLSPGERGRSSFGEQIENKFIDFTVAFCEPTMSDAIAVVVVIRCTSDFAWITRYPAAGGAKWNTAQKGTIFTVSFVSLARLENNFVCKMASTHQVSQKFRPLPVMCSDALKQGRLSFGRQVKNKYVGFWYYCKFVNGVFWDDYIQCYVNCRFLHERFCLLNEGSRAAEWGKTDHRAKWAIFAISFCGT